MRLDPGFSSSLGPNPNLVFSIEIHVHILDGKGNPELGDHSRSHLCYLIESSHKSDFYPKRPIFLHTCAACP